MSPQPWQGKGAGPSARPSAAQQPSPQLTARWVAVICLLSIPVIGLIVYVVVAGSTPTPPASWTPKSAIYGAKMACQKVGSDRLKAPASAQWGNLSEAYGEELTDGRYHVQLTVDAQNAFGALLRNTVDCRAKRSGDFFEVTSIKMLGQRKRLWKTGHSS